MVGERPFAAEAFQPQNPRPVDANMAPDKDAKRPPPAVVDRQVFLDFHATMRTRLAVATPLSRLHSSRVVLDFLLCCHNLEVYFQWGTRHDRNTVWCGPLFHFPSRQKKTIIRASKRGAGSHFEKNEGGIQAGLPERRGTSQRTMGLTSHPRLR
jgi:hypothetical protein